MALSVFDMRTDPNDPTRIMVILEGANRHELTSGAAQRTAIAAAKPHMTSPGFSSWGLYSIIPPGRDTPFTDEEMMQIPVPAGSRHLMEVNIGGRP